jgi:VIT1/CCC1 family predicted Fe2+/Mn2+ transporter
MAAKFLEPSNGVSMIATIVLVILILLLLGALPTWGHSNDWGYGPSGGLGLVLIIVVILFLVGVIPHSFG